MDQVMDGGRLPLEEWFWEMPVCTRWWTAATILTSALVQCHMVTPFQLFYSFRAVFAKSQVCERNPLSFYFVPPMPAGPGIPLCGSAFINSLFWHFSVSRSVADIWPQFWRLFTTFLYFGPFSLDLLFHIYFLQRYARLLEESLGRSPAHFSWLLFYAMTSLIVLSPLVSMPFLGQPLSSTLVYIWSRRNPDTRLSFLGLLVFTAPYLPWVLMAFSLFMHGSIPRDEIMGVVIGHIWYFFNDVYPPLHNGSRPLDPPVWWRRLFDGRGTEESQDGLNNDLIAAAGPGGREPAAANVL